jgi:hypothetical protein
MPGAGFALRIDNDYSGKKWLWFRKQAVTKIYFITLDEDKQLASKLMLELRKANVS